MQSASKVLTTAPDRRNARACAVLALLAASWSGAATAGDVLFICNPGVSLQASDARDVFLGEKGFAGGVKLLPADNSAAQAAFLEKVLKLDVAKYTSLWTKKSFREGVNPPPVKGSEAEAIAYVKQTAGACSYISGPAPAGVNVIGKF
jgi:hypothetical protein